MGDGADALDSDAAPAGAGEAGKRKREAITWFGKKARFLQVYTYTACLPLWGLAFDAHLHLPIVAIVALQLQEYTVHKRFRTHCADGLLETPSMRMITYHAVFSRPFLLGICVSGLTVHIGVAD